MTLVPDGGFPERLDLVNTQIETEFAGLMRPGVLTSESLSNRRKEGPR